MISSALFWLREYHLDGLRVDAVASMLYLDYGRGDGEWRPGRNGSNISEEAEFFFRALSSAVTETVPEALLIAEESTAYPGVTASPEAGGLGFHLKWNMGFSNDFFDYLSTPPELRVGKHSALNFPITYAFSERYILPVSHDEVVHEKGSFFGKMYGEEGEKLATFRAALLFLMTFPGKKLMFMGTEFGQRGEWDFDTSLDWGALRDGAHDGLREYVAALNRLYLASPALYEEDFSEAGFSWLLPDEAERDLVAFVRKDKGGDSLVVVISFSGAENKDIKIPLSEGGCYRTVFSTGDIGGNYESEGEENAITVSLPPFSGMVLRRRENSITL